MTWSEVTVVVVGALLLLLWWVWVTASRLDRLHRKVGASRAALDTQLVRRASAAAELASSGLLDPVSSVLLGEASWAALSAGENGRAELVDALPGLRLDRAERARATTTRIERDLAESELSRTVRTALADPAEVVALAEDPLGEAFLGALADSWYRVQLARRFHNEAVAQTQRMRRKALVRLLRLHGHARTPHTVEIDDTWPEALARPGEVT
ncbi:hypothetical protein [Actinotalea solisilvae]|uniref:hypothetical protein n=1 Tax=Actinotalea solisilvae TaxID=2072922 RepID=UPI0018F111E4|nr:hypothetical protein [Actinotalea solisilvae]